MYLGRSSITSSFNLASTKLHMDITDAYNVMLSAAKCPDGMPGFAEWTFLRANDACLFRKFMAEECGFEGPEDVIHSQTINLTPDLRERLFTKYGVRPITVALYPGDIVFIPAYCAHQVYFHLPPPLFVADTLAQVANRADCIKVASDYMSIDNLRRTEALVGELRRQRLASAYGDDVLAFYVTLWYAWQSLSEQLRDLSGSGMNSVQASVFFAEDDMPSPMDIDPLPTVPTMSPISTPSMQKAKRDKAYRQKKREEKQISQSQRKGVAFTFTCPHPLCCGKKLNRSGYIDHM